MSSSFRKRRARRGISLMEVLISMFVLTVGLLGVAALIPAGRHEIVEAAKLDNASMVGRAAFRDMQVRGFLNPAGWVAYPANFPAAVYDPSTPATPFKLYDPPTAAVDDFPHVAYVLDPLGLYSAALFDDAFPHAAPLSPIPPMRRIAPFGFAAGVTLAQQNAVFDSVFRSSFDQILEPNATNADFPPSPKWFSGNSRRMNEGNYTWLATIASDPARLATTGDVTVSVAVFYKRDLSNPSEANSEVLFAYPLTSGSSITIRNLPTDASGRLKPLKPGQWFMLAGRNPMTTSVSLPPYYYFYYRWYKVIAAAPPDGVTQRITIAGSDWNCTQNNSRAWIFDNIVNVYEKQMPLEVP